MIPKGVFTQVMMIIFAVVIIITYVKPVFAEINETQEKIALYTKERTKVLTVNSKLSQLISKMDKTVSNDDHRRLLTYLPDQIDNILVPRDLLAIVKESGMIYKNMTFEEVLKRRVPKKGSENTLRESFPLRHDFSILLEGTYIQTKNLFNLMAQNDYPLEIQSVSMKESEGGILSVEIKFISYSFNKDLIDSVTS